jgi:hypothetical protein
MHGSHEGGDHRSRTGVVLCAGTVGRARHRHAMIQPPFASRYTFRFRARLTVS